MDETPKDAINSAVASVQNGFKSEKLLDLDFRLDQLRNLYYGLQDLRDEFKAALAQDLHRDGNQTEYLEIHGSLVEIQENINNLSKWAKPQRVWGTDLRFISSVKYVQYKPYGSVLVISPWNYPIYVSIPPIAAAIAAGNTVVLKPSEYTPHVSRALAHLVEKYLSPDVAQVVLGGIPESTALLNDYKWDKIMVTGSTNVGRVVAQAAAKTLTPVLLELGGKSPVFVSIKNPSEIDLYAKRIVWGKFVNSGQTCTAPDYVLVEKKHAAAFKTATVKWAKKFYGDLDETSLQFAHAPTTKLAQRLRTLIAQTKGDFIFGSRFTEKELASLVDSKYVPPVIVENVTDDDILMKEEIFGPILPIIEIDDITVDGVAFVNRPQFDTPLAIYIFSTDEKQIDYIQNRIRAGAVSVLDTVLHVGCGDIPFGGVGNSGTGNYRGIHGFKAFSHEQAYFKNPTWIEFLLNMRYPPVTKDKEKIFRRLTLPSSPWFPRHGPVKKTLLQKLFKWQFLSLLTAVIAASLFLL